MIIIKQIDAGGDDDHDDGAYVDDDHDDWAVSDDDHDVHLEHALLDLMQGVKVEEETSNMM